MKSRSSLAIHILISLSLYPKQIFAVECNLITSNAKSVYSLPGVGYWMQPSGDCRIYYTAVGGNGSQIYNLCTKKVEKIQFLPDATPIPGTDDLYIEVYDDDINGYQGLSFFQRNNGPNAEAIYRDSNFMGNYPSIGLLPGSSSKTKLVRIASDDYEESGKSTVTLAKYQDFKIQGIKNSTGKSSYRIIPISKKQEILCDKKFFADLKVEIPILSRDGQMFAVKSNLTAHTKVFKIEPNKKCEEIGDIPLQTSKVSFSFDNKSIYFVAADRSTNNGQLMRYDIESKKFSVLSSSEEDVLYGVSKPDGSVFYTRRLKAATNENSLETSELVHLSFSSECRQKIQTDVHTAK